MTKRILNDGLIKAQEQSVKETESKLFKALEKQKKNAKVNISQLARDSGISRTQIINRYSYLYEGRENESAKVIELKNEIKELERKNNIQAKEITELKHSHKHTTDKMVELYAIIDNLKNKVNYDC
jgi:uncharacterized coiled-coil DUF342 family protein